MHSIRSILSALVILCVNTANWPVAAAPHIACRAECGSLAIDDADDDRLPDEP